MPISPGDPLAPYIGFSSQKYIADLDSWYPGLGGDGEANTASNAGLTGEGLVEPKSGVDLPFRSITAGENVTVTLDEPNKTLVIASTGGTTPTPTPVWDSGTGPGGQPGCVLWLRSDQLLENLVYGDTFGFWKDLSLTGHHALEDLVRVTHKPTLVDDGGPAADFTYVAGDPGEIGPTLITPEIINPGAGCTLYAVMKRKTPKHAGSSRFLEFVNDAGDDTETTAINDTGESGDGSLDHFLRYSESSGDQIIGSDVTDWFLIRLAIQFPDMNPNFNGVEGAAKTVHGDINNILKLRIGRLANNRYREIALFNSPLSGSPDAAIRADMNSRWSVY